jgi:hypothetical protein
MLFKKLLESCDATFDLNEADTAYLFHTVFQPCEEIISKSEIFDSKGQKVDLSLLTEKEKIELVKSMLKILHSFYKTQGELNEKESTTSSLIDFNGKSDKLQ